MLGYDEGITCCFVKSERVPPNFVWHVLIGKIDVDEVTGYALGPTRGW
jgi:hypothetical protein